MYKPTFKFDIDKRRVTTTGNNKGRFHVKLWVTFVVYVDGKKEWIVKPYKTNLFCSTSEFALVMDRNVNRVSVSIKDIRSELTTITSKVDHIFDKLNVTDQKRFDALFLSEHDIESLELHFKNKIQELELLKKISSKEKYVTALGSFNEFFKPFTFSACDPDQLQAYEDWYTDQLHGKVKKSLTSVGINMRCLRHIFNRAIKAQIIPITSYPFGVGKYVIPEGGDDTKKFLSNSEKNAFIEWSHSDDTVNRLHDYAKFSYYANGINMSDIARLKKADVFKEYISINRQKTKGRKKKNKKLIIPIHPAMTEIMNRRGKRSLNPDDYVFPILDLEMEEEERFYKIRDLVDDVNDVLAIMAKELNFEFKPTSYTLRHTFSFQFMQLGGTTDELQDALAHGSSKTTESYKHGFALEKKKKFSEGL